MAISEETLSKECVDLAISLMAHHDRVEQILRPLRQEDWKTALIYINYFDEWTDRYIKEGIFTEVEQKRLKADSERVKEATEKHNPRGHEFAAILSRTTFDLMFQKVVDCECQRRK